MAGGFYFSGFVVLVSLLGLHELYGLVRAKGAAPQVVNGMVLAVCICLVFMYARLKYAVVAVVDALGFAIPTPSMAQAFLIVLLVFTPIILLTELGRNKGSAIMNVATTLFGAMYVSLFFGCLIGLRELFGPEDFPVYLHFPVRGVSIPDDVLQTIHRWGGLTVIAIFASIWICDSAAYFVGRAIGRRKLFERVSPKKTWEGAAAGFIGAVLTFVLARSLLLTYMTLSNALVCGAVVGLFGQLGDLVESLLKRDAGVKDSSLLIPGHGGVLDRFDSLMFVAPLLYCYLEFIVF
jgi:phosphatidate cytidylyltransferase